MRIRFAFTIDITRPGKDNPEPETREYTGAYVDMAAPHPIGFVIPPTNAPDPFEGD